MRASGHALFEDILCTTPSSTSSHSLASRAPCFVGIGGTDLNSVFFVSAPPATGNSCMLTRVDVARTMNERFVTVWSRPVQCPHIPARSAEGKPTESSTNFAPLAVANNLVRLLFCGSSFMNVGCECHLRRSIFRTELLHSMFCTCFGMSVFAVLCLVMPNLAHIVDVFPHLKRFNA